MACVLPPPLNDITTTIYSSSDTLLNSNQCLSLFAAESLDSGIEEQLTALERALQTYFENTAAVARIQIYTNNPNLQNSEHIHYQQNFVLDEWRKTLGNNWSTWASLQRYTAIVRQPYRELTLIRRIGVASSKYQAFLVVGLDRNTIKNHLEQSSNETTISLDGTQIIYATDSVLIGKDMEFPDDFSGYIYRYTGPKEIGNQMRLVNYVTLQSYKSNNLFYVRIRAPGCLKNNQSYRCRICPDSGTCPACTIDSDDLFFGLFQHKDYNPEISNAPCQPRRLQYHRTIPR